MKPLRSLFASCLLTLGLLLACSSDPTTADDDRICAPGTNVVCRCDDAKQSGTQPCNDDGTGYSAACGPCDGSGRICSPNTEVICRCANGDSASQRCNGDGTGYTAACGPCDDTASGDPETCPGQRVAVSASAPTTLTLDLAGAKDDQSGTGDCSVGDGGADHVFAIVPATRGELSVEVVPRDGAHAPVVYLRSDSCDGAQIACNVAVAGGTASLSKQRVRRNETYWLVVDSVSGGGKVGAYDLKLSLVDVAYCGDREVDPGEVCDDGNNIDGDGCSADCLGFSGNPTSAIQCPGQPIHLWLDGQSRELVGTGSTHASELVGARNAFSIAGACNAPSGGSSSSTEHIYELIPHGDGELLLEVSDYGFFRPLVSLWETCDPNSDFLDCNFENEDGESILLPNFETDLIPLRDGQRYSLVIDGRVDSSGEYTLSLVYQ